MIDTDTRPTRRAIKALLCAGQADVADRLLQTWLAGHSDDADALAMLGQIRWIRGDWHGAEAAWRRSLANNSLDPAVHHSLGVLLHRRGRTLPPLGHFFAAAILEPPALGTQRYICNILARQFTQGST